MAKRKLLTPPTTPQLEAELRREKRKRDYRRTLLSTVCGLVIVIGVAALISMVWLPVLQVVGESMSPTLEEGQILMAPKGAEYEKGDIVAFYYNNKILVKRVIAVGGETVDIDEEGNVSIDGLILDEPYVSDRAIGDCNIELPYKVPEGKVFVMGDHRSISSDSRNTAVGCVATEQIVGKVSLRIWPIAQVGRIT